MAKIILSIAILLFLINSSYSQSKIVFFNNQVWYKISPQAADSILHQKQKYSWLKVDANSCRFFREENLQVPLMNYPRKPYLKKASNKLN